ncbi:MAG: putative sugar nucleotidyl transferase, partial [Bacteroidota bacterium]
HKSERRRSPAEKEGTMVRRICIFEDSQCAQFLPLVYFRPVYDLRCGIFQLKEKILLRVPKTAVTLQCRSYLAGSVQCDNPGMSVNEILADECLFINGRVLASPKLLKKIFSSTPEDIAYTHGHQIVAASVHGENLKKLRARLSAPLSPSDFSGIVSEEIDADLVSFPWDLVQKNPAQIGEDFAFIEKIIGSKKRIQGKLAAGTFLSGKKKIIIEPGAVLQPGSVLNAERGPIYIGRGVQIYPQTAIFGPVAILQNSTVKTGAQIYENTTIGPVCKVGGEIEGSILHGYSNKQHSGFLGHSYIGSWVNLGAGTNTSDLKNNYSTVRVTLGDRQVDTGLQFVGLTMGDHSKTAIGSKFNTGTVIGACCNIFGPAFPKKYVPSFSWGAAGEGTVVYAVEKAIAAAKKAMERRGIALSQVDEKIFRVVYETTVQERHAEGIEDGQGME